MTIRCPNGKKVKYRVMKKGIRLAFCDGKVVESKKLPKKKK